MRPYCISKLSTSRMLFGSLPVFTELQESIPTVTLDIFSKTLWKV